ncbi:MAG: sodium:solute symporter [Mangrovibacterium sp.]
MSITHISIVIASFLALLLLISHLTSKGGNKESFFTGNRKSPWYLVAWGMVGSTISGVTFISVPGEVGNSAWNYLQYLLGNMIGYWVIATVLIPLCYKLNLVSIYGYLAQRFGKRAYKIGASFFLLSQTIGASFRLFLAAGVLQITFFDKLGVPFGVTVLITLLTIWLYTRKAGIKTVVWTDTLQTTFILAAVIATIAVISSQLHLNFREMTHVVAQSDMSRVFNWDWRSGNFFVKQFLAGIATAIAINGLDQNFMQKNLTCKTAQESKKNIYWFSAAFIVSNIFFLSLGVLLYHYADVNAIPLPAHTDDLFPLLAVEYFGTFAGVLFLLGILAAAYSSADSAITALTTSFCIDFLHMEREQQHSARTRTLVHFGFSMLIFAVILIFQALNNQSVVTAVFKAVGYTYGPLLGLFTFGLTTKRQPNDKLVPYISVASPLVCYALSSNSVAWFNGYVFGFELLILNTAITFIGLLASSKKSI